jgi:23S rRNA (pseudouridine1915-N3)-methyltransferase
MRVLIAAVGRARAGAARSLYDDYAKRLPWRVTLREVEEKRKLANPARKHREGELLLATVSGHAVVVALDERGTALSSEDFAHRLGGWRDQGRDLVFLVGGADGLAPEVLERADFVLSLGPMTWPHLLVRVLLIEQLYRATSILAGHPYHRA